MEETKNPSCKEDLLDIIPTSHGPIEQPRSPAAAKTPNIGAPPFLKRRDAMLRDIGHITLTVIPHSAQKIIDKRGLLLKAITK